MTHSRTGSSGRHGYTYKVSIRTLTFAVSHLVLVVVLLWRAHAVSSSVLVYSVDKLRLSAHIFATKKRPQQLLAPSMKLEASTDDSSSM